ncbi:MAG: glutamate synthase subunit beta [Succinivibrio sp.]|nr:glutamate synthase subunit beta [Succinivibrio sp.]
MGFPTGFIDFERIEMPKRSIAERIHDYQEIYGTLSEHDGMVQAGRCMDCGTPFCMHTCPIHNDMPDLNNLVCQGKFSEAYALLERTSSFPEITGRICPALCEEGCTLGLHHESVGIKSIERLLGEYAFEQGLVLPKAPSRQSGCQVAVIGSGPAGLACAQLLRRQGHEVTVIEKMDKVGGLLRYGIPDFKLPKGILDRRIAQLKLEGIRFLTSTQVGDSLDTENGVHSDARTLISPEALLAEYDAIVLCPGSEVPRDLKIAGRELEGVYFALDFLIAQNRENNGNGQNPIKVEGRQVVVIGGGETASDCIGTAIRNGASKVIQLDYHEELPEEVPVTQYWPDYRRIKRTSTSHEEGCERRFATNTTAFLGSQKLEGVSTVRVVWGEGRHFEAQAGTEESIPCEIALIAMGYASPSEKLLRAFNLRLNDRRNLLPPKGRCGDYATAVPKVFAAGDGRRGQSLVVHAIAEGRECARQVHRYLTAKKLG